MDANPLDRGVSDAGAVSGQVQAYADWLTVTTRADLTLKLWAKVPGPEWVGGWTGRRLNDDLIYRTVTRAMTKINSHLRTPRKAARRPRLDAIVHLERGRSTGRPHVHALIERPQHWSEVYFAELIRKAWQAQPFGHEQARIEPIKDVRACLHYNLKADLQAGGDIVYVHKEQDESAWWRANWLRDWNEAAMEETNRSRSKRP